MEFLKCKLISEGGSRLPLPVLFPYHTIREIRPDMRRGGFVVTVWGDDNDYFIKGDKYGHALDDALVSVTGEYEMSQEEAETKF